MYRCNNCGVEIESPAAHVKGFGGGYTCETAICVSFTLLSGHKPDYCVRLGLVGIGESCHMDEGLAYKVFGMWPEGMNTLLQAKLNYYAAQLENVDNEVQEMQSKINKHKSVKDQLEGKMLAIKLEMQKNTRREDQ